MNEIGINVGLGGHYRLEAIRPDGTKRTLTDWFENIITDAGLNRIGTGGVLGICRVGSGSATPAVTDSALQSQVATTTTLFADTKFAQPTAPYFGTSQTIWRFAIGVAAGNLSEVGLGWIEGAGGLFSRSLIKDSGGSPTTITVLSDEILDVTYQLRLYPPLTDVTAVLNIGGIDRNIVLRAQNVVGSDDFTGWHPRPFQQFNNLYRDGLGVTPQAFGADGVGFFSLGAITQFIAGSVSGSNVGNAIDQTYVNASLSRVVLTSFPVDFGNLAGGVRGTDLRTSMGSFKCSFDPPLEKDNTKTMSFTWRVSWGRAP